MSGNEPQFTLRSMTAADAHAIAAWRYAGVYAFYDFTADPADLAELLTPETWGSSYFSVAAMNQDLVGFFQFEPQGDVLNIGLGLRPDLTGKGYGLPFVVAGLAFAQRRFTPRQFRLAVATFNSRAQRVYERAGFQALRTYWQATNGGQHEFVEMVRDATRTGHIVLLNGTSSAGKSTLAKALQTSLAEPYLHVGIDTMVFALPKRYLDPPLWQEVFQYTWPPAGSEGDLVIEAAPLGHQLISGLHQMIAALAQTGNNVIVDHVLLDPAWVSECATVLGRFPALLVGVYCPLAVVEQRERDRQDRTLGQARPRP